MRGRRVLVTGANGFVGQHAVRALAEAGAEVDAISLQEHANPAIVHLVRRYVRCDLSNADELRGLPLENYDAILSLAGLAAVGLSFAEPDRYLRVNAAVLANLGDLLVGRGATDVRVVAVSSASVYESGQPMPLTEASRVSPDSSPYAASKIAMEGAARRVTEQGVDCVIARPFNHIGPGQSRGFLVPDLFAAVTEAQAGEGVLIVGNLETRRDYTDVRDVVSAYTALLASPALPERVYNVCSGQALSGQQVLRHLLDAVGGGEIDIKVDPARFRPTDAPEVLGSSRQIREAVGWAPSIAPEQSIADFVAQASARQA